MPRSFASFAARSASAAGVVSVHSTSSAPACEMEWFWQNGQRRLHPKLPMESTGRPGRKNASGFFSIGSSASDVTLP